MSLESIDIPTLLRAHVHLQGAPLTEAELSKLWATYLGYGGTGRWQVREYVRVTGVGAREYRVVRGTSIPDVYRSRERGRAAAVGTALNELETPLAGDAPERGAERRSKSGGSKRRSAAGNGPEDDEGLRP